MTTFHTNATTTMAKPLVKTRWFYFILGVAHLALKAS